MVIYYRIIDTTSNEIVANGIGREEQAWETLYFYRTEYPDCEFEIERYADRRVSGWGRDPEVH